MLDLLKRYFVGNSCPILSIKRAPWHRGGYLPANGGNFCGFYWRGFHVFWRRPYASCWHWNPARRRWES